MKHNWTYKKLGELVDVLNGYAFKSSNYVKDGIRVIRIANVQKGKIVDEAPAFYPLSAESELTRYMLHEDDILLSLTGNVGRVGLLPKEMLPAALNQRVACLRIKDDTLMFKFLYQFLNSDYFEQKCIESSRGIAQLNMSTEWLKDYPLPIPSLDEQQAIVRELDGINRLIDLQEEQLREYDRLAQSLFYTTFGDPTTNPKGWEVKKFGEILSYIKNGANIKQTRGAGGLPITRIETLSGGVFNRDRLGYADITDLSKYANFYLETGDLLMSHINSKTYIGRTVMYEKEGDETIIHGMNLLRLKVVRDIVNPVYVCYYCKTDRFKGDVAKIRKDAVNQSSICISDIVRISLPLPPLALQQSFAAQIEAIEQQKALIRRSLDETRTLLAARMQYYFE